MELYREIACKVQARLNCIKSNNTEWESNHEQWLLDAAKDGPSGSGIDCGTKIDLDRSTPNKLVFTFEYHHMDEDGMYCGWTSHELIVTPSLTSGCDLRITGRNRNGIKDHLHEVYHDWLMESCIV